MAGWVGPTMALSLVVIALCCVGFLTSVLLALREAAERGQSLAKEIAEFRRDIGPTLDSLNRLGESGAEVAELAKEEVREIIYTTRRLRKDVERGALRAKRRLADFEAVVDLVQDEVEETALDVTTAMRTFRTGRGMVGRLRRLILPRRRGAA